MKSGGGRPIVRPFWFGADYKKENYSGDCVVIDNPPFSILGQILDYYIKRDIKFFLFAPTLTNFSYGARDVCHVICDGRVVYENGACVNTSFITNLDTCKIRTAPELRRAISEAKNGNKPRQLKYKYPDNCITIKDICYFARRDIDLKINNNLHFIRTLDHQRLNKKSIFGAGFLCSNDTAEFKKVLPQSEHDITWRLSERELKIIEELNNNV